VLVAELLGFDVRSKAESRSKSVADTVVPGVARVSDGCRHAGCDVHCFVVDCFVFTNKQFQTLLIASG